MTKRYSFFATLYLLALPVICIAESETDLALRVQRLEETVVALEKRVKAQGFHIREHQERLKIVSSGGKVPSSIQEPSEVGISQQELNEVLENLEKYMTQFRTVPYFRNGKAIGVRFFAIRRGSVLERYGLKNGDILLSVDDQRIESTKHLEQSLFGKSSLNYRELKIERAGKPVTLRVPISE